MSSARSGLLGYVDLLRECPDFTRLWIATIISLGGDWFSAVAVLALVQELTNSPLVTGWVLISASVPVALFSPLAGLVADRFDRRRIMVVCNAAAAVVTLGYLLVQQKGDVWICYAVSAGLMAIATFYGPAANATMPNLVPPHHLLKANTLMGSAWGTMLAVGAGLGGLVATFMGREAAFIIDAISFVGAALLCASIRGQTHGERESGTPQSPRWDEALDYLKQRPDVAVLGLAKSGWATGSGILVLLSVFPMQVFKAGDAGVGMLYAFRGMGALCGPIFGQKLIQDNLRRMPAFIAGGLLLVGGSYIAFSQAPTMGYAAVALLISHLGAGTVWSFSATILQNRVPNRMLGRILALEMGLITAIMTLAQYFGGYWAETIGPRTSGFRCGFAVLIYAAAWWVAWSVTSMRASAGDRADVPKG